MGKTLELNEKELRNVINEAVRLVLSESDSQENKTNKRGETIGLSPAFEDGLYDLQNKYEHLKGFISEYPIVIKSLLSNAQKIGLILKDFSTEKYFELEDAFNGQTYDFDFEFTVPNVDISKMSDEEYEEFEKKLEDMYDDLEYSIGRPQFGSFRMYTTDDGIQVYYTFRMAERKDY